MACSRCLLQRLLSPISGLSMKMNLFPVRLKFTKADLEALKENKNSTVDKNLKKSVSSKITEGKRSAKGEKSTDKITKETSSKGDNPTDMPIQKDKTLLKDEKGIKIDDQTKQHHDDILKPLDYVLKVPMFTSEVSELCVNQEFKGFVEKMFVRSLPSVTTVISNTQTPKSLFFLKRWKDKMVAEMGEEGFKAYKEETFRQGVNFHANVQEFLTGKSVDDIQIDPSNEGHWNSLKRVFPQIKDVVSVETPVVHPTLFYKGVFDCVAVYKDSLCVIDWKTSKQPKPLLSNTYDNPMQVAAYIGAVNSSQVLADQGVGIIKTGVLIIAYPKGYPAHIHFMDQATCKDYWERWLERLQLYWKNMAEKKLGLKDSNDKTSDENYTEF